VKSGFQLPQLSIPNRVSQAVNNLPSPNVGTPSVGTPNVGLPNVSLPKVGLPNIGLPNLGQTQIEPFGQQGGNASFPANYADLDVYVAETQTGRINFGGAFNSDNGIVGQFTIDEKNFDITRWPLSPARTSSDTWLALLNRTGWVPTIVSPPVDTCSSVSSLTGTRSDWVGDFHWEEG